MTLSAGQHLEESAYDPQIKHLRVPEEDPNEMQKIYSAITKVRLRRNLKNDVMTLFLNSFPYVPPLSAWWTVAPQ
jgi:hypothetical protein